ncbi:LacI family DNA-binding transcriptional regulator [Streptomyces sp. NPDC058464]|uniref:LacI family DNA-binding transcriptional regulator n=1 Tax=Streptomyces sp. NPDC058464 TaxID=3346511 RepID=UPI003654845E
MTRPPKRTTGVDVARAAGVSPTTVSYVLNDRPGQSIPEETRRRVVEAAQRLNYRPHASARALAAGRSDIVLLTIPDLPIGPSISRFVEELAGSLAGHGLTLVTHLLGAHGRPLLDVCATLGPSAVLGLAPFDQDTVQALHRLGATVVLPTNVDQPPPWESVGRLQAEHVIQRGHRRIGYALPENSSYRQMAEGRLLGVTNACAAAGIAPPVVVTMDLEITSSTRAVTAWKGQDVTAVCTFNDETAIVLLAGMREHGLHAPDDLAVIGVDDHPMARFASPPLSTVFFDVLEAGRHRAEAVLAALAGREGNFPISPTNPQVIARSST